jgi:hypothetical protein
MWYGRNNFYILGIRIKIRIEIRIVSFLYFLLYCVNIKDGDEGIGI